MPPRRQMPGHAAAHPARQSLDRVVSHGGGTTHTARQLPTPAPLSHGKLLHALILRVHDVQMSFAVEGQAVWRGELAGGGALRAETAQVGAGGGELLHAMVGGADPEAIL